MDAREDWYQIRMAGRVRRSQHWGVSVGCDETLYPEPGKASRTADIRTGMENVSAAPWTAGSQPSLTGLSRSSFIPAVPAGLFSFAPDGAWSAAGENVLTLVWASVWLIAIAICWLLQSRRSPAKAGRMKIARRFNGGKARITSESPQGTAEGSHAINRAHIRLQRHGVQEVSRP
jgi:hypothetical protein